MSLTIVFFCSCQGMRPKNRCSWNSPVSFGTRKHSICQSQAFAWILNILILQYSHYLCIYAFLTFCEWVQSFYTSSWNFWSLPCFNLDAMQCLQMARRLCSRYCINQKYGQDLLHSVLFVTIKLCLLEVDRHCIVQNLRALQSNPTYSRKSYRPSQEWCFRPSH